MNFKKAILLFFLFFLSTACSEAVEFAKEEVSFLSSERNKKIKITVELAVTKEQQLKGFMNRKVIPEGTGMIFLYSSDSKLSFWMKNTSVPLSIAFISSNGIIKEIRELEPYSLEAVVSTYSVRYAMETPRGMFERLGLKVGDVITEESLLTLKRHIKSKKY